MLGLKLNHVSKRGYCYLLQAMITMYVSKASFHGRRHYVEKSFCLTYALLCEPMFTYSQSIHWEQTLVNIDNFHIRNLNQDHWKRTQQIYQNSRGQYVAMFRKVECAGCIGRESIDDISYILTPAVCWTACKKHYCENTNK